MSTSGRVRPGRGAAGGPGQGSRAPAGPPLWTVTFTAAVVVNFLLNLVFYMLMTTTAVYAIGRFGADGTTAGLAASIFVMGALACRLLSTVLLVRVGAMRLFVLGAVLSFLFSLLYLAAEPLWVLMLVRFLHGAGFGLAHSAVGSIAQSVLPHARRGEGVGYFGTAATMGTALGPFAGLYAVANAGYSALFLAVATVLAAALAGGLLLRVKAAHHPEGTAADGRQPREEPDPTPAAAPPLRETLRRILPIGLIAFFQSIAYAGVAAFMDVHTAALGLGALAGSFFLVYASAVILVRLMTGRIVDRHGPATVFYPSAALYAAGLVLVATAPSAPVLYLGAVLLGIGYGSLLPTGQTIAMGLLPRRQSGTAFVWYFLFVDLGFGFGPFLLGALVDGIGTTAMILISCSFVAMAGVMFRTLLPAPVRCGKSSEKTFRE